MCVLGVHSLFAVPCVCWFVVTDLQRVCSLTTLLYLLLDDALYVCVFRCWFGLFRIGPSSLYCGSCGKLSRMITKAVFNQLRIACHLTVCLLFKQY